MERTFTTQLLSMRKTQSNSAAFPADEAIALGGELLAGSGFEGEVPDREFSDAGEKHELFVERE